MGQNNKGITRGELERRVIELLKAHSEKDSSPIAIAINGNWGVGKSYMYRESLAVKIQEVLGRAPIYTSVFGKKDENAIIQDLVAQFLKNNEVLDSLKSVVDCVGKIGLSLMQLPSANLGFILDFFKKKELKNTIVCIDDFERLSDKIPMQDILGLISELKENKGCHIILLCSEDHIGAEQRSAFYHYKEKIIDFDFFYNPRPMEQLRIFEGNQEYERYVAQIADDPSIKAIMDRFQITNLREIRKLIFYFNSYCERLENGIDDVKECQESGRTSFFAAAFVIVVKARVLYRFQKDEKLTKEYCEQNEQIIQGQATWLNSNTLSSVKKHDIRLREIEKLIDDYFADEPRKYTGQYKEWYKNRQQWLSDLFDNNIPTEINDFSAERNYLLGLTKSY